MPAKRETAPGRQLPEAPVRARSACAALTRRAHSASSICGRQFLQFLQGRRTFRHQAVAPGLHALEALGLLRIHLAARIQRRTDRRGVHVAHQLADVLALPGAGGAAGERAQGADRILQRSRAGQVPRAELPAGRDQFHAQILRGAARRACARSCSGARPPRLLQVRRLLRGSLVFSRVLAPGVKSRPAATIQVYPSSPITHDATTAHRPGLRAAQGRRQPCPRGGQAPGASQARRMPA